MPALLLIEDDEAVAAVVRRHLAKIREGWALHHCATVSDARAAMRGAAFDAALVDIALGDAPRGGVMLIRELLERRNGLPVAGFTAQSDAALDNELFVLGVGVVKKNAAFAPALDTFLARASRADLATLAARELGLTPREEEICRRIFAGATLRQVADELGIALPTLRTHVRRVLRKGAATRARTMKDLQVALLKRGA